MDILYVRWWDGAINIWSIFREDAINIWSFFWDDAIKDVKTVPGEQCNFPPLLHADRCVAMRRLWNQHSEEGTITQPLGAQNDVSSLHL